MPAPISVGIIGAGTHGSRYARHIVKDLPDLLKLQAISRRSAEGEKQAADWQCHFYPEWSDLIQDPMVEAIISAVPPTMNEAIAEACVEAGKPLLLEKPLACDRQTGQKIVQQFSQKNLKLTVAQTLRFNAAIIALKESFHRVGKLYTLAAHHRLEPSQLTWLESPEVAGGGVIFQTAVHLFDAIRFITGMEITRIRGTATNWHNALLEDCLTAQIVLSGNVLGVVDASKVSPSRSGRFEFVGQHGQLHGDQIHHRLEFIRQSSIEALHTPPEKPTLIDLLSAWHAYLLDNGPNPVPGIEGLQAIRICDACRQSLASGTWVDIPAPGNE